MPHDVGNIYTTQEPIVPKPATPNADSIGVGTTDLVPGHTTRLTFTQDEVKSADPQSRNAK